MVNLKMWLKVREPLSLKDQAEQSNPVGMRPPTRLIAGDALTLAAVAITVYLVLVVAGYIPTENRLGAAELGLASVGCLFLNWRSTQKRSTG